MNHSDCAKAERTVDSQINESGKTLNKNLPKPEAVREGKFREDLREVINRHSVDNLLNVPDFILAEVALESMKIFGVGVQQRNNFFHH